MDARSAREWSSEAAAQAIRPNSLRYRCYISEETGKLYIRFIALKPLLYSLFLVKCSRYVHTI